MSALSFDVLRDGIIHDPVFQAACQRHAHGNGSSEAITMAVLTAIGYPDLYLDALRYRYLRGRDLDTIGASGVFAGLTPENVVINGDDLDARVDAALELEFCS